MSAKNVDKLHSQHGKPCRPGRGGGPSRRFIPTEWHLSARNLCSPARGVLTNTYYCCLTPHPMRTAPGGLCTDDAANTFLRAAFLCREFSGGIARFCDGKTIAHILSASGAGEWLACGSSNYAIPQAACPPHLLGGPLLRLEHVKNSGSVAAILQGPRNLSTKIHVRMPAVATSEDGLGNADAELSDEMSQVAFLVLGNIDRPEFSFTCEPTVVGSKVLHTVSAAVFGSTDRSLVESVLMGKLAQARLAQELSTAALVDAVEPHNCFSVFLLATSCGCSRLAKHAARCGLQNFAAAVRRDHAGFIALSEEQLLRFTRHDAVEVSTCVQAPPRPGVERAYGGLA